MVVQDGFGAYVDDTVQIDPPAPRLDPVMPDAEPPGKPVAGVADGTAPCQQGGYDAAHDPHVCLRYDSRIIP